MNTVNTGTAMLTVSGWGVLSSAGPGVKDFSARLAAELPAPVEAADLFGEPAASPYAHTLVGFDVREHLGARGTRYLDRSTSLALVACGQALADSDLVVDEANAGRVGVVLGTTTGSLKTAVDYSRDCLVNERPYQVSSLQFPSTSMNCAASQAAIRYQLKGVNATLAGGPLAALSALRYADNAFRRGQVDALLVGAVEEFSPQAAWLLEAQHPEVLGRAPIGEGAAVFLVEGPGSAGRGSGRRRPDAEVLGVELGQYAPPGESPDPGEGLAHCIRRALSAAGVRPGDVRLVVTSEGGGPELDAVEQAALARTVPQAPRLAVKHYFGEARAAAGALQIAAVLAVHRDEPLRDGWVSLITACSADGAVGAAVLKGWCRNESP